MNPNHFSIDGMEQSIIKVIGVGGGGGNAVSHMYRQGIKGVEFFVCNTDIQALDASPIPNKIQIGKNLTQGLGAGANPDKGRQAALENKEDIREFLSQNTRMVFITAGMGGGTGTGAAPVIAEVARELGVLTVGIVTAPFSFEGRPKRIRANEGVDALRNHCDTVLVILNDKLRDVYGRASMKEAFRQADNVLLKAAKSIAEIITVSGHINVDFEDVRTVMKDAGAAVMGSATAEGENRARRAAEAAISSPLLNNVNIFGAKYILLSIVVGDDEEFQMEELEEIMSYVQQQGGEDAEIIMGQATDENLGDSISVTIIATGFEYNSDLPSDNQDTRRTYDFSTNRIGNQFSTKNHRGNGNNFESNDFFENREDASKSKNIYNTTESSEYIPPIVEPVKHTTPPDRYFFDLNDSNESEKKKLNERSFSENTTPIKPMSEMTEDQIKELKDIPTFLRRNISLNQSYNEPKI